MDQDNLLLKTEDSLSEMLMKDDEKSLPDILFKKSNIVIGAKYKASLLENKILSVALSRIQENNRGEIVANIHAYEIKDYMGYKGNSIYERLKTVAAQMGGRMFFLEDEEKTRWSMQSIVIGAEYEKNSGLFTVFFNNKLKKILVNLKTSYTNLYLPLLLSFKSDYSFRLYEWLKSKCYTPKGAPPKDVFIIETTVNELKITIGMVNTETDKVKAAMMAPNPDFDHIVENLALEKTYTEWYEFKRSVLDVGIKEINKNPMSDITVSYEAKKGGVGAKVRKVVFICEKRKREEITDENSDVLNKPGESQILTMIESIEDNIDVPIKIKDIRAILEAAQYDVEKVYAAFELLKKQRNVKNITGWIIKCIKENFSEPVSFQGKNSANSFQKFEYKQNYDMDEIEKEFIEN